MPMDLQMALAKGSFAVPLNIFKIVYSLNRFTVVPQTKKRGASLALV